MRKAIFIVTLILSRSAIASFGGPCETADYSVNCGDSPTLFSGDRSGVIYGHASGTILHEVTCDEDFGGGQHGPVTIMYCFVYIPPTGLEDKIGTSSKLPDTPYNQCGSVINTDSRSLGENIPIPSAGITLNYSSERAKGRAADYTLNIPVPSKGDLTNVASIELKLQVAGRDIVQNLPPTDDQIITYKWDGKDNLGNLTKASALAIATSTYKSSSGQKLRSLTFSYPVGHLKASLLGFGGWTPSSYHFYDAASGVLYRGDGSVRHLKSDLRSDNTYLVPEEDGSLAYVFNQSGQHLKTLAGYTGKVLSTFTHASGKLIQITNAWGRTIDFNRDGTGALMSIKAPNGQITIFERDPNGYLSKVTLPDGKAYVLTTNSSGLLTSFQTPGGQVSSFTYDSLGFLKKDQHSGGYFLSLFDDPNYSYAKYSLTPMNRRSGIERSQESAEGRFYERQNVSGPDGFLSQVNATPDIIQTGYRDWFESATRKPEYRFNQNYFKTEVYTGPRSVFREQAVALINPSDVFSISTLSVSEYLTADKIPLGTTNYNGTSRTWVKTSAEGEKFSTVWDDAQRPTSEQAGSNYPITYTYIGDQMTEFSQGSRTTRMTYDPTTLLLSGIINPLNQTTSFAYDGSQNLTIRTLADGRQIKYGYDANNVLVSVTPPGRPAHSLTRNVYGLLGNYKAPKVGTENNVTTYTYNLDKQISKITRPDGKEIVYNYIEGKSQISNLVSGEEYWYYAWDAYGNLGYIDRINGFSSGMEHLNGLIVGTYSNVPGGNLNLRYDLDTSNRAVNAKISVDNNTPIEFPMTYNKDEKLKTVGDVIFTYSYPSGVLKTAAVGAYKDTFTYDLYGQRIGQTSKNGTKLLFSETVTPDALGRVSVLSETIGGTTTKYTYAYDSTGRLKTVSVNDSLVSDFTYDGNSNIISGTRRGQTLNSTFDAQDRIKTSPGRTYTFNSAGELTKVTNTTTGKSTKFGYDVFSTLRSATLESGKVITYEPDGFHRLAQRTSGTTVRSYLYDEKSRVIGEVGPDFVFKKIYVYGSKPNVPDYMITSGMKYRIISDHLGSVRLVVRMSDGVIMQKMDYDEWGRVLVDSNPGFQLFGFAGGIYDTETKLTLFVARWYNADLGRWMTKDPILFGGGDTNLYGYVKQDPINSVDPRGMQTEEDDFYKSRIDQVKDYVEALVGTLKDKVETIFNWGQKNIDEYEEANKKFDNLRAPDSVPSESPGIKSPANPNNGAGAGVWGPPGGPSGWSVNPANSRTSKKCQ